MLIVSVGLADCMLCILKLLIVTIKENFQSQKVNEMWRGGGKECNKISVVYNWSYKNEPDGFYFYFWILNQFSSLTNSV